MGGGARGAPTTSQPAAASGVFGGDSTPADPEAAAELAQRLQPFQKVADHGALNLT